MLVRKSFWPLHINENNQLQLLKIFILKYLVVQKVYVCGYQYSCDKCRGLLQIKWISHASVKAIDGEIACFVLISPETQAFLASFEIKRKRK